MNNRVRGDSTEIRRPRKSSGEAELQPPSAKWRVLGREPFAQRQLCGDDQGGLKGLREDRSGWNVMGRGREKREARSRHRVWVLLYGNGKPQVLSQGVVT